MYKMYKMLKMLKMFVKIIKNFLRFRSLIRIRRQHRTDQFLSFWFDFDGFFTGIGFFQFPDDVGKFGAGSERNQQLKGNHSYWVDVNLKTKILVGAEIDEEGR